MKSGNKEPTVNNTNDKKSLIDNEMINGLFNYWFSDHEKMRSPFPEYVREEVRSKSLDKFFDWLKDFSENLQVKENEKLIAERLEQLLFETALHLVKTGDEKMTLFYPFLPRVGDQILKKNSKHDQHYIVMKRKFIKNGDEKFMKVIASNIGTGEKWETSFELPV